MLRSGVDCEWYKWCEGDECSRKAREGGATPSPPRMMITSMEQASVWGQYTHNTTYGRISASWIRVRDTCVHVCVCVCNEAIRWPGASLATRCQNDLLRTAQPALGGKFPSTLLYCADTWICDYETIDTPSSIRYTLDLAPAPLLLLGPLPCRRAAVEDVRHERRSLW